MDEGFSKLFDQFGALIPRSAIAQLQEPEAEPSAFSARPPFVGDLADRLRPDRLGAIMHAASTGSTRDWFILAEEIEELFPHYLSVLSKRKRQVSGLPMTVEPAEGVKDADRHADFVRAWLSRGAVEESLFDVLDGIGKGYSVNELIWKPVKGGFAPEEILWRNQRDFEVSWNDGHTLWLRTDAGYADLFPHKFLVHAHRLKSGLPVRSGLTRAVAWLWMYATYSAKDWALFVQGYGLPMRLGRYGAGASASDKRVLWRAVRGIAGDMAAILPSSMQIEFVESKAATEGSKLFEGRMNWLNAEVSKLTLGGVAGTDAVAGSHAVGKDHRAAEQDVEKFDARLVAASINRQVVQAMVAFSFGPQDAYPRLRIGQQELAPISDVIAAAADLGPLGFRVRAQDIYDRLQLTKPEGDDEIIGIPLPVPGAPGGDAAGGSPIASQDDKIKANPHPAINPDSDARAMMNRQSGAAQYRTAQAQRHGYGPLVGRLVLQTSTPTDIMTALENRLAQDAKAGLAQMTAQVRRCAEEATDLPDLAARLSKLQLSGDDFATAIMQGMALAHLAGQANVMDELK